MKTVVVICVVALILLVINIPRILRNKQYQIDLGLSFHHTITKYHQMLQFTELVLGGQLDLSVVSNMEQNGDVDRICMDILNRQSDGLELFSEKFSSLIKSTARSLMAFGDAVYRGEKEKMEQSRAELERSCKIGKNVVAFLSGNSVIFQERCPATLEGARFYGANVEKMSRNRRWGKPLDRGVDPHFIGLQRSVNELISDAMEGTK